MQICYRNNENSIHHNYYDIHAYVEGSKADMASLDNTTYEGKQILSKAIVYILLIMFQISLHYNKNIIKRRYQM